MPQRRVLVGLLAALVAFLAVRYALNGAHVDERGISSRDRSAELLSRLDPNTASAEDLAALPVLGAKQAQAIVEYRQRAADGDERAFTKPADLLKVKGIGVQTLEAIEPYLDFPATRRPEPATEPVER